MLPSLIGVIASSGGGVATSYESIATVTLGSPASSASFSSIPSTYSHLQIRMLANMNADINIRFNGDTGSNYAYHYVYGAGSSPVASGDPNKAYGYIGYGGFGGSTAFTAGVIDILDYTSTNKAKTVRSLTGNDGNTTGGGVMLASSLWFATPAAISSISIYSSGGGNFGTNSSFALYGIKG